MSSKRVRRNRYAVADVIKLSTGCGASPDSTAGCTQNGNGANIGAPSNSEKDISSKKREKDSVQNNLESLDWGQSIPSYLQSTHSHEICDEWSNAIEEAEAVASARKKAIEQGRDPEDAELESRKAAKLFRSVSIWNRIRQEAARDIETEPMLSSFLFTSILSHESFGEALAFVLSNRIADETLLPTQLFSLFMTLERKHPEVLQGAVNDLEAVYQRVCLGPCFVGDQQTRLHIFHMGFCQYSVRLPAGPRLPKLLSGPALLQRVPRDTVVSVFARSVD